MVVPSDRSTERGLRRRDLLRAGIAGGIGTGAVAVAGCTQDRGPAADVGTRHTAAPHQRVSAFHGPHQSGVADPPPPYAVWVALDLAPAADRDSLRRLLSVWTDDISRLMAGRGPLTDMEPELAAAPAGLTVTVGLGPGAFAAAGLEDRRPEWLAPLPAFAVDRLDPARSGGDLVLQVCADSPVTVAHAQRQLITAAGSLAAVRWVQRGFREPLPALPMRNLFGQIDGTVNLRTDGADDSLLWIGDGDPGLAGGTAMVVRRIAMDLDAWDRVDRGARENAVGRRLSDGGPLTGQGPDAPADLDARDALGFPVIDTFSHLRRAMPATPRERFLRRPYNYDEEPQPGQRSSSGLVFVAFCADPVEQFLPVQQRLAEADLLNLWTTPTGSAVFAVLPGVQPGERLGQGLLG